MRIIEGKVMMFIEPDGELSFSSAGGRNDIIYFYEEKSFKEYEKLLEENARLRKDSKQLESDDRYETKRSVVLEEVNDSLEEENDRLRKEVEILQEKLRPGSVTERAPTQWAYDKACEALNLANKEKDKFRQALEDIANNSWYQNGYTQARDDQERRYILVDRLNYISNLVRATLMDKKG